MNKFSKMKVHCRPITSACLFGI